MFSLLLTSALLLIGDQKIQVEIADTQETRNRGLMYRQDLTDNEGMLFVFEKSDFQSFWMKNTKIPLSIGFFDVEKKLFEIQNMEPPLFPDAPLKIYQSKFKAKYALEVPQNWFQKNKIFPGQKFSLQDLD